MQCYWSVIKRGHLDTDRHTGRTSQTMRADCGDTAEAKEHQRLPAYHQELGEAWKKFFQPTEETNPGLELLASRTMRQQIYVV